MTDTGPFWGARVFAPRKGQDHLGLGSVSSDRILPMLSPGINVLTIHPRYWSFYSLVLADFWATDLPRTRSAFRAFYRPREAMFAFACQVCPAPEHETLKGNIVGSQATMSMAATASEFPPDFAYIKEDLGGYGLYYRTVMETTGLLQRPDEQALLPFDAPTPSGQAVASAYRAAVAGTAFYREHWPTLDSPVPREVLEEFARAGCLCQLRTAHDHDLPLLQDLFLHEGGVGESRARRQTLRMFLDLATWTGPEPIDRDVFRQLIYFQTHVGRKYAPAPGVVDTARLWRLYQAREYFSFALNRLWAWLVRSGLEWSDDGLRAVPMDEVWKHIRKALQRNKFSELTGLAGGPIRADTTVADLADGLARTVRVSATLDGEWKRHDALDEHALYEWTNNAVDDPETLVAMLALLTLIYRRIGSPGTVASLDPAGQFIHSAGGRLRVGMTPFFAQLQKRTMAGETAEQVLKWILDTHVITQHERVAVAKLPEDTFRFRRVGSDLTFIGGPLPVGFNNSRFDALSTMVHELGLTSTLQETRRTLTPAGAALLADGDLPAGALARATEGAASA